MENSRLEKIIIWVVITTFLWSNFVWAEGLEFYKLSAPSQVAALATLADAFGTGQQTIRNLVNNGIADKDAFYREMSKGKIGSLSGVPCLVFSDKEDNSRLAYYVFNPKEPYFSRITTYPEVNDSLWAYLRLVGIENRAFPEAREFEDKGKKYYQQVFTAADDEKGLINTCLEKIFSGQEIGLGHSDIAQLFTLSHEETDKMILRFQDEMGKGLNGQESSLQMLLTFIDNPTGEETGKYIGIDFGGSNLRVFIVDLKGNGKIEYIGDMISLKEEKDGKVLYDYTKGVTREQFFDFIADFVIKVLKDNNYNSGEEYNSGFGFSFPVEQKGIDSGLLIKWVKGFDVQGVVGEDVVRLLRDAFLRRGYSNIKIMALLNDTVATQVKMAYESEDCSMALILATGTNVCYLEDVRNIDKSGTGYDFQRMIINIESADFDKLQRNKYDEQIDRQFETGSQTLGKMVSGKYLGEIARLVLMDLIREGVLFIGKDVLVFNESGNFTTKDMGIIEADKSPDLLETDGILEELGIKDSTLKDRKIIQDACCMVTTRAAQIVGAKIAAVIKKIDPVLSKVHTVAVDGSVYEKYPGMREKIMDVLINIFGREAKDRIRMVLVKDASGIGAAIAAAVALKRKGPDTIYFKPPDAFGETILATCVLKAIHERFPGTVIKVILNPIRSALLEGYLKQNDPIGGFIDELINPDDPSYPREGVIDISWHQDLLPNIAPLHYTETMFRCAEKQFKEKSGLDVKLDHGHSCELRFVGHRFEEDIKKGKQYAAELLERCKREGKEGIIWLGTSATSQNRMHPKGKKFWQQIVERLKDRFLFYEIRGLNTDPVCEGVLPNKGEEIKEFAALAEVLKATVAGIGIDGMHMHFANALGKKNMVLVLGPTHPAAIVYPDAKENMLTVPAIEEVSGCYACGNHGYMNASVFSEISKAMGERLGRDFQFDEETQNALQVNTPESVKGLKIRCREIQNGEHMYDCWDKVDPDKVVEKLNQFFTEKIAVTGGTGSIGSQFVKWLLHRRGAKIDVLVRKLDEKTRERIGAIDNRVTTREAGLFNISALREMVISNDVVFHLAGWSKSGDEVLEEEAFLTNCLSTALLAELAKEYNKRLVFTSSGVVYRLGKNKKGNLKEDELELPEDVKGFVDKAVDEFAQYAERVVGQTTKEQESEMMFIRRFLQDNPIPKGVGIYDLTKIIGEYIVLRHKNSICFRLTDVYGPGDYTGRRIPSVFRAVLEGKAKCYVKDDVRQYIYIDDVMKVLEKSIDINLEDNRVINVPGPNMVKTMDAANVVKRLHNSDVEIIGVPTGVAPVTADGSLLREKFGITPAVSFDDGIARTYAWWLEHIKERDSIEYIKKLMSKKIFKESEVDEFLKKVRALSVDLRQVAELLEIVFEYLYMVDGARDEIYYFYRSVTEDLPGLLRIYPMFEDRNMALRKKIGNLKKELSRKNRAKEGLVIRNIFSWLARANEEGYTGDIPRTGFGEYTIEATPNVSRDIVSFSIEPFMPGDEILMEEWYEYARKNNMGFRVPRFYEWQGAIEGLVKGFKVVSIDKEGRKRIEGWSVFDEVIGEGIYESYYENASWNKGDKRELKGIAMALRKRLIEESVYRGYKGRIISIPETEDGIRFARATFKKPNYTPKTQYGEVNWSYWTLSPKSAEAFLRGYKVGSYGLDEKRTGVHRGEVLRYDTMITPPLSVIEPEDLSDIKRADRGGFIEKVLKYQEAGADGIHFDVREEVYLKKLEEGGIRPDRPVNTHLLNPQLIRELRDNGLTLPVDVHLLYYKPSKEYLSSYKDLGVRSILVQYNGFDSKEELIDTLRTVRSLGIRSGVVIELDESVLLLSKDILEEADIVVFSSAPTTGVGREYTPIEDKVMELRKAGYRGEILIQGGVDPDNIGKLTASGATTFVVGTYLIKSEDMKGAVRYLKKKAIAGVHKEIIHSGDQGELQVYDIGGKKVEIDCRDGVQKSSPHADLFVDILPKLINEYVAKHGKGSVIGTAGELGTGRGTVAVALALLSPQTKVYALDVNPLSVELAQENAIRNALTSERFESRCGNMLEPVKDIKFDVLISTLPSQPISEEKERVLDKDTLQMVSGGADGSELIRAFINQASRLLNPDGEIWFVMHDFTNVNDRIEAALKEAGFVSEQIAVMRRYKDETTFTAQNWDDILKLGYKSNVDETGREYFNIVIMRGILCRTDITYNDMYYLSGLKIPRIREYITDLMSFCFGQFGISREEVERMVEIIAGCNNFREARAVLHRAGFKWHKQGDRFHDIYRDYKDKKAARVKYKTLKDYIKGNGFGKNAVVIDIGCGNHTIAREMIREMRGKVPEENIPRVIGVDFADNINTEDPHGKLEYRKVETEGKVPIPGEGLADKIYIFSALHHMREDVINSILGEAKRLLKPDGELVIFEDVVLEGQMPESNEEGLALERIKELSEEEKRIAYTIFDWHANLVVSNDIYVPMPGSYFTETKWRDIFSNAGFDVKYAEYVGVYKGKFSNLPHSVFVLKKNGPIKGYDDEAYAECVEDMKGVKQITEEEESIAIIRDSIVSGRKQGHVFVVAIDGNSGALKSSTAIRVADMLESRGQKTVVIRRDWFIRGRTERYDEIKKELRDNEVSLRDEEMYLGIERIEEFEKVLQALEDFNNGTEPEITLHLSGLYDKYGGGELTGYKDIPIDRNTVVIIEGNYLLKERWSRYFDLKVLMLTRPSTGIARRKDRDTHTDSQEVAKMFWRMNTPSFINYLRGRMPNAKMGKPDIVIHTDSWERKYRELYEIDVNNAGLASGCKIIGERGWTNREKKMLSEVIDKLVSMYGTSILAVIDAIRVVAGLEEDSKGAIIEEGGRYILLLDISSFGVPEFNRDDSEYLLYSIMERELIRSIMSIIPSRDNVIRELTINYMVLKSAYNRGLKITKETIEEIGAYEQFFEALEVLQGMEEVSDNDIIAVAIEHMRGMPYHRELFRQFSFAGEWEKRIKDTEGRYRSALRVFNEIMEAKKGLKETVEGVGINIKVVNTFTGKMRILGLEGLPRRLQGMIGTVAKLIYSFDRFSCSITKATDRKYIYVDSKRLEELKGIIGNKEYGRIVKNLSDNNYQMCTEIPQGIDLGNVIRLVDPGDLENIPEFTGMLYLPLPYTRGSLYMAANILQAGGEIDKIDPLIKGLLNELYRGLDDNDLVLLFTQPWRILPKIQDVLDNLDNLRKAIAQIEKAA